MSLKSMTGYGRGEAAASGLKVEVELSSVNRKQLDVHINLPKAIAALESRVFELIHETIARGHVSGMVTVSVSDRARRQGVWVDRVLVDAYVRELRKTARAYGLADNLSARDVLDMPEAVHYEYVERDIEKIWPVLQRAMRHALASMVEMRRREGAVLARDLRARMEKLQVVYLARIRRMAPQVAAKYRRTLQARLKHAGFRLGSGDQQLMKELALYAERSDITEEITRLGSHITQASQLLASKAPVGRTLDFLAQEMLREINTIGSKANDAVIVRDVIHFKTELERIREQVQNLE